MWNRLAQWWRRHRTSSLVIQESTWRAIETMLALTHHLDTASRLRLRELALTFLNSKQIHGAHDFEVTDTMRLSIALQACLPVLNLGIEWYDDWVGVIVYQGDFLIPRQITDDAGVVHEYLEPAQGEAWEGGPVLLAWQPERDQRDGVNVVLHEFAHKLDMRDGMADGIPPLPRKIGHKRWQLVFQRAFENFRSRLDLDDEALPMDPYAAEHPAEFFAVAVETFFGAPDWLFGDYPEVYELLREFLGQDPLTGRIKNEECATPGMMPIRGR
ncbi:MAG TPA: zinc-dependent peptidase [Rhodocyclaceae bacterium]|nr:zinc-dependent peptidase [Rhodocyclaceae bacterium]